MDPSGDSAFSMDGGEETEEMSLLGSAGAQVRAVCEGLRHAGL